MYRAVGGAQSLTVRYAICHNDVSVYIYIYNVYNDKNNNKNDNNHSNNIINNSNNIIVVVNNSETVNSY